MPLNHLGPCPACGGSGADPVGESADFLHVDACRGCRRLRVDRAPTDMPESPAAPIGFAAELVRRHALTSDDLVVEIGSGTGNRLRAVRRLGPRVLGIEPRLLDTTRAFQAGVDTIGAMFGPGVAEYVARRYGPARVLLIRDLRAVGCEPPELLSGAARCLTADGVIVAEVLVGDALRMIELLPAAMSAAVPAAA